MKQTTNENLLHSIGNSQCSVVTYMGRKTKNTERICIHIWLIHIAV